MSHSSLNNLPVQVSLNDGSGQQWIPDNNVQLRHPSAESWTRLTNRNGSTDAIGVNLTPIGVSNSTHFNVQNDTLRYGNYLEIACQRRYCLEKTLAPSVGYNDGNNAQSNGRFYTNHNSYQQQPRFIMTPNKVCNGGANNPKRVRTVFTTLQMVELKLEYARTRYLDRTRRQKLSCSLQLSEETIKVWFQNRRMKDRVEAENLQKSEVTSTTE